MKLTQHVNSNAIIVHVTAESSNSKQFPMVSASTGGGGDISPSFNIYLLKWAAKIEIYHGFAPKWNRNRFDLSASSACTAQVLPKLYAILYLNVISVESC